MENISTNCRDSKFSNAYLTGRTTNCEVPKRDSVSSKSVFIKLFVQRNPRIALSRGGQCTYQNS